MRRSKSFLMPIIKNNNVLFSVLFFTLLNEKEMHDFRFQADYSSCFNLCKMSEVSVSIHLRLENSH